MEKRKWVWSGTVAGLVAAAGSAAFAQGVSP